MLNTDVRRENVQDIIIAATATPVEGQRINAKGFGLVLLGLPVDRPVFVTFDDGNIQVPMATGRIIRAEFNSFKLHYGAGVSQAVVALILNDGFDVENLGESSDESAIIADTGSVTLPTNQEAKVGASLNYAWDGGANSWGKLNLNAMLAMFSPASRTVTQQGAITNNFNYRGLTLYFALSVVPGVDTVGVEIWAYDSFELLSFRIAQFAPIAAPGQYVYCLYPGIVDTTAQYTGIQAGALPRFFFTRVLHSGAGAFTYSLHGAQMV